jgi:hypothetical protein
MKREYNREKAAYDEALEAYMKSCEEASVDSFSESEDGTGSETSDYAGHVLQSRPPRMQEELHYVLPPPAFDREPPVEADYGALEKRYFGDLSYKLEVLKGLHSDVWRLTDHTMQTLRSACVNISQKVRLSCFLMCCHHILFLFCLPCPTTLLLCCAVLCCAVAYISSVSCCVCLLL